MRTVKLGKWVKLVAGTTMVFAVSVILLPGLTGRGASSDTGVAGAVFVAQKTPAKPTQQNGTFELKGSVAGLYPTVVRTLPVKIENPNSQPIKVTDLKITAGDVRSGGVVRCSGNWLRLNNITDDAGANTVSITVSAPIPARGERFIYVAVELRNVASDGCQNATIPLTYTGKAVKA